MDGRRFDNLARLIGAGYSRRRLFKLAGGLAGGVAAIAVQGSTSAAPCNADAECAPGVCCADGSCTPGVLPNECCGSDPDPSARCPAGYVCFEGTCDPVPCVTDSDCATGICCSGICDAVECCSFDADPNPRCPSGYVCSFGFCREASCATDADCAESICCAGQCQDPSAQCCMIEGDSHCAPHQVCFEAVCDPRPCQTQSDCPPGAACAQGACVLVDEPGCQSDAQCTDGICCGGSCIAGSVGLSAVCCLSDSDPDARCPSGSYCYAGVCAPDDVAGQCCAAQRAGLACAPGECCTLAAAPSDFCPAGGSCESSGPDGEGVCVANGAGDNSAVDKWTLWTGAEPLHGATFYLRRLTDDDDPDEMSALPIGPDYRQADFDRLAAYGARYVDLSHPAWYAEAAPYRAEPDVQEHLAHLVRHARRAKLYAVLSLRTGPGRGESTASPFPICQAGGCFSGGPSEPHTLPAASALWSEPAAQDAWVDLWRATAETFRDNPTVIGYHLLAMPDAPDAKRYRALVERIVAAIREVDQETPILISPLGAGRPEDLSGMTPLGDERVIYRVDAFAPARYLRQPAAAASPLTYGDPFVPARDGVDGAFDRAWIADMLAPALRWASDHRRPVAIGGYGMPRWQPGLAAYLDDLITAIETAGMRHALWMWHPEYGPVVDDAFNLEHGADPGGHTLADASLIDLVSAHWTGPTGD